MIIKQVGKQNLAYIVLNIKTLTYYTSLVADPTKLFVEVYCYAIMNPFTFTY